MAETQQPTLRRILTMPEAAEFLRVSERTLWARVQAGEVPHFRVGKQYRFSRERLEQMSDDGGEGSR